MDANRIVLATYAYDAWGNWGRTITSGLTGLSSYIAYNNPFLYRGYYYDAETGFYYLNSRYYDPEVGRFLTTVTVEPNSFINGMNSYNGYVYYSDNPVNGRSVDNHPNVIAETAKVVVQNTVLGATSVPVFAPRQALLDADDLDIVSTSPLDYNCYGNAIQKAIKEMPFGYELGDSSVEVLRAVIRDLGGYGNVRILASIDSPIAPDEYKVALRCSSDDFHFIRLTDNGWFNKPGEGFGYYVDESYVSNATWSVNLGNEPYVYDDSVIYIAIKRGWAD